MEAKDTETERKFNDENNGEIVSLGCQDILPLVLLGISFSAADLSIKKWIRIAIAQ